MKRRRKPIYVESRIRASLDALWDHTQDPALHQRWDVRFGEIEYQPKTGPEQRFTYATRIAPGVRVAGTGESLGDRERPDGSRWSGLKFWADHPLSIIRTGAGYWRYVPTDDGIRFLTRYDYLPRWGGVGAVVDRFVFRPLFGWATAWSFDRLRLWLECGVDPSEARRRALAHAFASGGTAAVWIYQGLVPKLLLQDADELRLLRQAGIAPGHERRLLRLVGLAEIALGGATIVAARRRWPYVATLVLVPALSVGALKTDARSFGRAFNPGSLNIALMGLAAIALCTDHDLPSGRHPLRAAPDEQPPVGELP